MDWQPIETAPKELPDVLDFLLGLCNGKVYAIQWDDEDGWRDAVNHDGWDYANLSPTHWMPIPEAPHSTP